MASRRDYKAEYQRRIAAAETLGVSRSAARGHARSHTETNVAGKSVKVYDELPAAIARRIKAEGSTNIVQASGGRTVVAVGKGKNRRKVYVSPKARDKLTANLDVLGAEVEDTPT